MYSIAILLSCLEFLNKLNEEIQNYSIFLNKKTYMYTTPAIIVDNLKKASLINIEQNEIHLSNRSKKYITLTHANDFSITLDNDNIKVLLRELLKEFLISQRFSWLYYLYQGRYECLSKIKNFETKRSMVITLNQLNLLKETDEKVICWWRDLEKAYLDKDEKNKNTGMIGEKLSREYELRRVGKLPYWESLFSNNSGYDLRSIISKDNKTQLKIEVKATEGENYTFFLTRNEWNTALKSKNYIFHFWTLANRELFIFTPNQIREYIPLDNNQSKWTECEIKLLKDDAEKFRLSNRMFYY